MLTTGKNSKNVFHSCLLVFFENLMFFFCCDTKRPSKRRPQSKFSFPSSSWPPVAFTTEGMDTKQLIIIPRNNVYENFLVSSSLLSRLSPPPVPAVTERSGLALHFTFEADKTSDASTVHQFCSIHIRCAESESERTRNLSIPRVFVSLPSFFDYYPTAKRNERAK